MKRAIIVFILALFLFPVIYAQTKKVTILDPLGNVSAMRKAIVRAKLEEALINSGSYEVISNAELLCITQFTDKDNDFFVESYLQEQESGIIVASADQIIVNTSITEFEKGCIQLAAKLVWWSTVGTSSNNTGGNNWSNGETYNMDGIELVYVEGADSGSMPIKGFFIGKFEVTQAQWKAIMGSNLSQFVDDNLPVENVSWYDAREFLTKLNAVTGRNYRLPTEAEWEFAARGGTIGKGYVYSGSNCIDSVAWYRANSGMQKKNKKKKFEHKEQIVQYQYVRFQGNHTHFVGTKQPNELGIYDMTGNVWEWCEDWYDNSQQQHVVRGGGWDNFDRFCRVSVRTSSVPSNRDSHLGFRVALSL